MRYGAGMVNFERLALLGVFIAVMAGLGYGLKWLIDHTDYGLPVLALLLLIGLLLQPRSRTDR
jgi:hypothetical protein